MANLSQRVDRLEQAADGPALPTWAEFITLDGDELREKYPGLYADWVGLAEVGEDGKQPE